MDERAKEARRKAQREYREKNRERINQTKKEWREKNKEKLNAKKREWNAKNPDRVRQHRENYWQRKAEQAGLTCFHCGQPFEAKRSDAKYCSTRCRIAFNRIK